MGIYLEIIIRNLSYDCLKNKSANLINGTNIMIFFFVDQLKKHTFSEMEQIKSSYKFMGLKNLDGQFSLSGENKKT